MARSRFIRDTGLTVRMTFAMFLLGALFVGLVVGLMYFAPGGWAVIVAAIAIGIVVFQWWRSDTVAMRAMQAYEITPEEEPELYGTVQRLSTLADMPMPRVGISELELPNAFATGRSPDRAVVCVTRGLQRLLTPEELEAVLAHELSHVAHRDVLVMTVASSAGIMAGLLGKGAQFGGMGLSGRNRGGNGNALGFIGLLALSLIVYAISFILLRLLSRYREMCADRSAAFLTQKPSALASALTKISGGIAATPQRDLRAPAGMNAFCIAPAIQGLSWKTLTSTHPSLEQRLDQLARIAAELGRPFDGPPARS